jgi:hypothetical protein
MQRLSASLHGTLGSYRRDALQEGILLMLWHAFLFLGLFVFFPPCSILLGDFHCFFLLKCCFRLKKYCRVCFIETGPICH